MMTPDPSPRDPAVVIAAVLGLLAAGGLLALVTLFAGAPAVPAAAPTTARAAARTMAEVTAVGAAAVANGPAPSPPATSAGTPATTATATVAATATVTATAATTATLAAGRAGQDTANASVRQIQPPPPFFSFRRPFGPQNAVEASRYYPYGTTGRGEYLLHHGIDIGNPMEARVLAVGDGEVVYAGDDVQRLWGPQPDFYGNVVVIRHPETLDGQPLYSLYGHLSAVKVEAGQSVAAGDLVGLVGMAGIALGPHLHLEFRVGEPGYASTRNAELFLAPLAGRGTIVGRVASATGAPVPKAQVVLFRNNGGEDAYVAEATTYPAQHVNATAELGENFLFADLPAGVYRLSASGGGVRASVPVTVTDGAALFVDLRP